MKFRKAAVATLLFLFVLVVVYVVHVRYFPVDVVFYAALLDGLLAALVACLLLFRLGWFAALNAFEKLQLSVIWLLIAYALAISVPTVIDRSLSFYILEKLQQRGGAIRLDSFARVFTEEYLVEHRLVDVRLTEQTQSGTIEIRDGCVQLTARGRRLATFSRFFRRQLLPRRRLLMGSYSDDLTDPFRHSRADPGYECHPR